MSEPPDGEQFEDAVMVTYLDVEAIWDCYFIIDGHGTHEHAQFIDLQEAIRLGKARTTRVRVWDPDLGTAPYV